MDHIDREVVKDVIKEILREDPQVLKEVVKEILIENQVIISEEQEIRRARIKELIEEDFDKYDSVFKDLA